MNQGFTIRFKNATTTTGSSKITVSWIPFSLTNLFWDTLYTRTEVQY